MMGGYNIAGKGIYFTKTFFLLPHSYVTISINAYAIDSWDNEYFYVNAGVQRIIHEKFSHRHGK
jgi:hypothetical protein